MSKSAPKSKRKGEPKSWAKLGRESGKYHGITRKVTRDSKRVCYDFQPPFGKMNKHSGQDSR